MAAVVAVVVTSVGAVSSPSCLAELGDGTTAAVWDDKRLITSCTRVGMSCLLRSSSLFSSCLGSIWSMGGSLLLPWSLTARAPRRVSLVTVVATSTWIHLFAGGSFESFLPLERFPFPRPMLLFSQQHGNKTTRQKTNSADTLDY